MSDQEEILARLERFTDIQHELQDILQTLVLNDSTMIDALAQILVAVQKMNTRAEQTQRAVEKAQDRLASEVRTLTATIASLAPTPHAGEPIIIASRGFTEQNPDVALLQHLRPFLRSAVAVDVGAHVGEVAALLLDAGYCVQAFEPYPPSFEALQRRLGGRPDFSATPLAIGAADGDGLLNVAASDDEAASPSLYNSLIVHPLAEGVAFASTLPVPVRSVGSLVEEGAIPRSFGLLKIDAEGYDREVIEGMGGADCEIVVAEFWDPAHVFGRGGHGQLGPLIEAMRLRGYDRHVVIYHVTEEGLTSYYFNSRDTVRGAWGNVLFFRDPVLFGHAARWCEHALRPTLHR